MILKDGESLKVVHVKPDGTLLAGFVGGFLYDPPVLMDDGTYAPGEWTPSVNPECFRKGYHVTKCPRVWWVLSNPRAYLVECRGSFSSPGDMDNMGACESIRLLRPLTSDEMQFFGIAPK